MLIKIILVKIEMMGLYQIEKMLPPIYHTCVIIYSYYYKLLLYL